jgi:hypothetical protein
MRQKLSFRLAFAVILAFGPACVCGFADDSADKHSRPKKVFTNDDLQKYQNGDQADSKTDGAATNKGKKVNQDDSPASPKTAEKGAMGRSYWANRLRESEENLSQAKKEEQKFRENLGNFQEKFREAKSEFQKKTLKWQIEDTETNLDRSIARRKKAEEDKGNILAEAAKKGFKLEDLNKGEEPLTKSSQ